MAVAVILVIVAMLVSTKAPECLEGQQCSNCSRTTGHCETKCFGGYFGVRCKSNCSNRCLNGVCETTKRGIGLCTEGCKLGYYGSDCRRPCQRQENICSECQSGCGHGYCVSSCVSDRVDSYYGPDCKNCSSRCKTCNRITGACTECYTPYTGPECQYSGLCEAGCMEGCGPQVNGSFCFEACGGNCRPSPNMNDKTRCLAPGVNASAHCTSECHNQSGECLHGCVDGWYGPQCSSPCSAGCRGGGCDAAGACVDGCFTGYSGEFCNETCEMCRDGVCDQISGTCITGCNVSERACGTSCTSHCSREYCRGEICKTEKSKTNDMSIGISTGCVLLVLAILVSNYVCYRKGRSAKRRGNLSDVAHSPTVEYQSCHKYYEIDEACIEAKEPTENQENLEDLGLAMPVIADVFPSAEAIVHRVEDMSSESSASSTYESYTHLIPEVVTDDQGTVDSYISPVEEMAIHPPDPDVVTDDQGAVDSYIPPVEELTPHPPDP